MVDDESAIRLLCRVNLELEGYRVQEAATLGEARSIVGGGAIDVVVLDVHVGVEDGWTLADELRDGESGVRVVLLTGSVTVSSTDASRVDAVLRKPFAIEDLLTAVRRLATLRSGAS